MTCARNNLTIEQYKARLKTKKKKQSMKVSYFIIILIILSSSVLAVDFKIIDEEHTIFNHKVILKVTNTDTKDLLYNFNFDVTGLSRSFEIEKPKIEIQRTKTELQPIYTSYEVEIACQKPLPNETKQDKCFETLQNVVYQNVLVNSWEDVGVIKTTLTSKETKLSNDFLLWSKTDYIIRVSWQIPLNDVWASAGTWGINPIGWWNTSYDYRMLINCSNIDTDVPIMINGSKGLLLPSGSDRQYIMTQCRPDLFIYFNNDTDYIIGNDSTGFAFDVVNGNGTAYNPTDTYPDYYKSYWAFEEDYNDRLGINNLTGVNNPTLTTTNCFFGENCLNTEPANAYLTGSDTGFPLGDNPRTFYCWIRPIGYETGSWNSMFGYGSTGGTNNQAQALFVNAEPAQQTWYLTYKGNDYNTNIKVNVSRNYLAIMYLNDTHTGLWLNDTMVGSQTESTGTVSGVTRISTSTWESNYNGDFLYGACAVLNKTFNQEEVTDIYNNGIDLVGYGILGEVETPPTPDVSVLDILFLNDSGIDINTFDSAEEFTPKINLTLSNVAVTDSNCTLEFPNGLIETEAPDQNFTLCNSGCNYTKYLFQISGMETTNAVRDMVRMDLCYPQTTPSDLVINATCGAIPISRTIASVDIPSCSEGALTFILNNTLCPNETGINIDFVNNAPNSKRVNILNLLHDREYSVLEIDLTYNATNSLYENEDLVYYDANVINVTAQCVNTDDTKNATTTEQLTISNVPPLVFHTIIWVDSDVFEFIDDVELNFTDLSTITFFSSEFDENFLNSTHYINASNGSIIWQDEHTELTYNHSFSGSEFNQDNYSFVTIARDSALLTTNLTTRFKVLKYIPSSTMQNVAITPSIANIGDELNCSGTATDDFNSSLYMSFEWFDDGVLQTAYSVNKTALNNTLTYTNILVNTTDVSLWTCSVRAFGTSWSSWLNDTILIKNPLWPTLNCSYNPRPYIKFVDKIEWVCLIDKRAQTASTTTATINCDYDRTPYIRPLDQIEWLCSINSTT